MLMRTVEETLSTLSWFTLIIHVHQLLPIFDMTCEPPSCLEWCLILTIENRKFLKWDHTKLSIVKCDCYHCNSVLVISIIWENIELSSSFKIPAMKFKNICEYPKVSSFTGKIIKRQENLVQVYNWNFLIVTINKYCCMLATHFCMSKLPLNTK